MNACQAREVGATGTVFWYNTRMNKTNKDMAKAIREAAEELVAKRLTQVRNESLAAFRKSGVPELFEDAPLVIKELEGIVRYVLDGCKSGIPRLRSYSEILVKRMLSTYACFRYDPWVYNDRLTDAELIALGMPKDDDESVARYCVHRDDDTIVLERRSCYTAQRRLLKAFSDYVRTSAAFAAEIKSEKGVDRWVRAFGIVVRYDAKADAPPYSIQDLENIFAFINQATDETYVTWMTPQLPTLAELREERKA